MTDSINKNSINKKRKNRYYTLQFNISVTFIILIFFIFGILFIVNTYFIDKILMGNIKSELIMTLKSAQKFIDGEAHTKIKRLAHEYNEDFKKIFDILKHFRDINKKITYIYTLRKNENGQIYFCVDATSNVKNRSRFGDIVYQPTKEMIEIFNSKEDILIEKTPNSDYWGTWISGYIKFYRENGDFEGVIGMDIALDTIKKYKFVNMIFIIVTFLIVLVLGMFSSYILSKNIAKPIEIITDEIRKIQNFILNNKIKIVSSIIEINHLYKALIKMKISIKSFIKYVPVDIVKNIVKKGEIARLQVEKKNISVMFTDIENYTYICEKTKPKNINKALSFYLEKMGKVIAKYKGTIDKFIGDSIMAIWNAPKKVKNYEKLSVLACLKCLQINEKINKVLEKNNISHFKTRIGLNSGEVIIGNMGERNRLNYTAIGDTVNIASRLEKINKFYDTKLLTTESIYENTKNIINARLIDKIVFKGKTNHITIYEILSKKNNNSHKEYCEKYNLAMEYYFKREWQKAIEIFENLKEDQTISSKPREIIIERCKNLISQNQDEKWDGVIHFKESIVYD